MQRIYIDANAGLGRTNQREGRIPYTVGSLVDDMEYYRVHASLVYSYTARDYSFVKGNRQLMDDIKTNNRLFGVGVVIPDFKYELREGIKYQEMLVDEGIKAFKMYPTRHNFEFDPFFLEDIVEFMIERKIPMVVDLGEVGYKELGHILDAFSELNILLCNSSWSDNRKLFKLMEKYNNLYYEISSNQANDLLDVSKKFFGVERVLFSTDYPNKVMGGLKALVEYSGLSEAEKDMIAGVNAARLFNLDIEKISCYDESGCMLDNIARKVDKGLPLKEVLVIDSHTHMVDQEHQAISAIPMFSSDEDSMVKKMDILGIDKILAVPWEGITTTGDSANETVLHAHEKYPERIEAYAMFNPNYENDIDKVIGYYHGECRFMGIKPYHPLHKIDLLDKKYEKWFEYGDRNSLFALIHAESPEIPQKVEVLSKKYKNLIFILAHSGQSYEMARHNIAAAKKCDNIFLEITYTALTNGVIEFMVDEVGADRVLFGSDMPMRDPAPQLAWVCYARISEEDKKKILGKNMKKIMERCYGK
jgi:Predicted metal-dependent hydrolase of the TIM-barrel fold